MTIKNLKTIAQQTFRTIFTIAILVNLIFAQKQAKPNSADFYFKQGLAKMKAAEILKIPNLAVKKYEKAIKSFDKAIEINPDEAKFYFVRGKCLYKTSDVQFAMEDFNTAIELAPNFADAYLERGKITADLKLTDEDREETLKRSISDFDQAIKLNSNTADFYYTRSIFFNYLEENEKALQEINKAIELNPRFSKAFIFRAKLYLQKKDYEKSVADSTKGLNLNLQDVEGLLIRGQANVALGKHETAVADYNLALKLEPNNSDIYFWYAWAYQKMGKKKEAKAYALKEKQLSDKLYDKLPEFAKQIFHGLSKESIEAIRPIN